MPDLPDDAWIPRVAKRALNLLSDQCNELEGRVAVLARAIRDIEAEAESANAMDDAFDALGTIVHICQTGGVRTAMGA